MKHIGGLFTKALTMLALGLFLLLPTVSVSAQDGWWGNRRDDNSRREQRRREERRQRREERRNDRRDDRYDDRNDDRNDDRYDNRQNNGNRRRGRNWDGYANYGGSYQLRQTALNAGYNNGIEEGRKDRQRGDRFDYRDEGDYRNATKDYSSRLGDRETYRRYFRDAFATGYEDGYRGY